MQITWPLWRSQLGLRRQGLSTQGHGDCNDPRVRGLWWLRLKVRRVRQARAGADSREAGDARRSSAARRRTALAHALH